MTNNTPKYRSFKHGMNGTPEYYAYYDMIRRCYKESRKGYEHYGGRGIKVCDRWLESFINFYEDMGNRPDKGYSLDRIDHNGNYEPSNCRWADWKTQENNRRNNRKITINGITKNVQQWCDEYNLPDTTFHNRLNRGWENEKLLEPPLNRECI